MTAPRHRSAPLGLCLLLLACSPDPAADGGTLGSGGGLPSGGAFGTGGGLPSGGAPGSGGQGAGGQPGNSGGAGASGGGASGGGSAGSGGSASGGHPSGGAPSTGGGANTGGAATGGAATGGASSGGNAPFSPPFILGADISGTQESTATYVDTDGETKSLFEVLKNHGFNSIRLKTFVDPLAPYGYASSANDCMGSGEAFGDKAHVIEYGKRAKEAGMGFLLDFHYSDVWADPGNQIIPDAWRDAANIAELAMLMKAYTVDVIASAVDAGARPDMVQVGNEITPGMLAHVPGPDTDCWGNNPEAAPFGGSTSNWDNLATLLKAGIAGVREVDPTIPVMLHIENTDSLSGVRSWVTSALSRGVEFDILGLSCYTAFQGQPSVWQNTFSSLASEFPQLSFVIAEYNPARTEANRMMKNLPDGRGLGTFFWEPTRSGEWGDALFTFQDGQFVANSDDFAEYDALRSELGL